MARLANIRVWSYIAARADWTRDALTFQAEARKAEDAVSDALHERLTARFVDRRAAHLMRRLDDTEGEDLLSAVTRQGEVVVEGHTVGKVAGFLFHPEAEAATEEERKLVLRAARRALREEMPRRVAAVETAKDDAFALTANHRVTWTSPGAEPAEIARLRIGDQPGKPQVEVLASEFLDGAQRERVRARLAKYVDGLVAKELAILSTIEAKAEAEGSLRGPAFQLREHLGLVPGNTNAEISQDLRQKLKGIGVRAGRFALFVPEALKPRAMALRAQLWAMSRNIDTPALPAPGLVALQLREAHEGETNPPPPDRLAARLRPDHGLAAGRAGAAAARCRGTHRRRARLPDPPGAGAAAARPRQPARRQGGHPGGGADRARLPPAGSPAAGGERVRPADPAARRPAAAATPSPAPAWPAAAWPARGPPRPGTASPAGRGTPGRSAAGRAAASPPRCASGGPARGPT